ncbi:MAG: universal stress protein [Caulobacter sp.]|nr:universal stress protein [Caulobacter sp.]
MSYKDILLHLDSYPDPTPMDVVDEAMRICAALGEGVTAAAFPVRIPLKSNFLPDRLIGLARLAEAEESRSAENVAQLLARFRAEAARHGLRHRELTSQLDEFDRPARLAELARTHDLCVIPYVGEVASQTAFAEAVVFGAGRPVLIFRGRAGRIRPGGFRKVLVAWDGGRAASRAVADAMPVLIQAEEVRILTVLGDKPSAVGRGADALMAHLALHGVSAEAEDYTAAGRGAGKILEQVADERGFDLLVMGAYGHSRLREFLLGGATQYILTAPPVPVLMSH